MLMESRRRMKDALARRADSVSYSSINILLFTREFTRNFLFFYWEVLSGTKSYLSPDKNSYTPIEVVNEVV